MIITEWLILLTLTSWQNNCTGSNNIVMIDSAHSVVHYSINQHDFPYFFYSTPFLLLAQEGQLNLALSYFSFHPVGCLSLEKRFEKGLALDGRAVEILITFFDTSSFPPSSQKEAFLLVYFLLFLSCSLNSSCRFSTRRRFAEASQRFIFRWKYLLKSSFFSSPLPIEYEFINSNIGNRNISFANNIFLLIKHIFKTVIISI